MKHAQRQHWRTVRRQAMAAVAPQLQASVHSALGALHSPGRLGLYWAIGAEPQLCAPAPTWADGLALPRTCPDGIEYVAWSPGDALEPDHCGIPAPLGPALEPEDLALLLVPALAADPRGYRLGSGGGWYDRLRSQTRWRGRTALMVLPSALCNASVAVEPWDVPFNGVINEAGLSWFKPGQC